MKTSKATHDSNILPASSPFSCCTWSDYNYVGDRLFHMSSFVCINPCDVCIMVPNRPPEREREREGLQLSEVTVGLHQEAVTLGETLTTAEKHA